MQRPPAPAAIPEPSRPELPRHIGIIMDGNGRWARRRHLPRAAGHRAGVATIRPVMEACHAAGVHILTLYAFSTENWSRPRHEVAALMQLFGDTIDSEVGEMHAEGIQIRAIGDRSKLSPRLQQKVRAAEELTSHNTRAILNVAINYGGRHEIVAAVRDLASRGVDLSRPRHRDAGRGPLHRGAARSRPDRPHRRGDAHQQLHALAGGLRGDLRHRDALARFRRRRHRARPRRLCRAGPSLRRRA